MYGSDAVATFTADRPGEYELRISVVTMGADNVTKRIDQEAEHSVQIIANGEALNAGVAEGGCTASGLGAKPSLGTWLVLSLGALGLWRRRRRA